MQRSLLVLTAAALLSAGCGGASSHTFSANGEQFGEGECHGNECHFDFTFGAPVLTAWTPAGDARGDVFVTLADADRIWEGGGVHRLEVDGQRIRGAHVTPDGTIWRDGVAVGALHRDLDIDRGEVTRLVDPRGRTLDAARLGFPID